MLTALHSLDGEATLKLTISYKTGASGMVQAVVWQVCSLSPTLFGMFLKDLHVQLRSDCLPAGLDCQGMEAPALCYADDVVPFSATANGSAAIA